MGKLSRDESDDDWQPDQRSNSDGRILQADVDAMPVITGRRLSQPGIDAAQRSRALSASDDITLQDLQARGFGSEAA